SGYLLERFHRVCDALAAAFGAPFTVADEDDVERLVGIGAATALAGIATGSVVAIEQDEPRQLAVFLCLHVDGPRRQFAWGTCRLVDETFATKLAQQVYANVLQEEQMDEIRSASLSYVSQVTHDFEELCWLRSLAQGLEFCHLAAEVTAVTQ